jgi:hypothetical protein
MLQCAAHPGMTHCVLRFQCWCGCFMQAYLMFGDRQYLDMFIELYAATMRHMKVGGHTRWGVPEGGGQCVCLGGRTGVGVQVAGL